MLTTACDQPLWEGHLDMTSRYPSLNLYTRHQSIIAQVQQDEPQKLKELLEEREHGPDELARALREAADKGHVECVEILLENKALPNLHDASGFTPLINAARKGHAHIIKLLLKHNVKVNKPTYRIRATALHWAATNGHYGAVRALIAAGANTECCTVHSRTPIMLAARSNQQDIVDALIQAGAQVNARDYERATALHLAAEEGSTDCVETLIRAGSDVNAQTRTGDTPIIKAARGGHPEVLRLLFRRGGDISRRGRCMTALHWAAESGNLECTRMFLKEGINCDEVTEDSYCGADFLVSAGVTPLMLAARGGYSHVLDVLVEAGATVDRVDEDGRSPLMYAVHANHPHCVTALLGYGADPDGVPIPSEPLSDEMESESAGHESFQADRGLSPLFLAIKRKVHPILFILLRANCSVAVIGHTSHGDPVGPLEYALSLGNKTSIYALLVAGAGITVINPQFMHTSLLDLVQKDEETAFDIMHRIAKPPTLLERCRFAIRKVIGDHMTMTSSIQQLPLPPPVKRYLEFSEFEDLL